MHAHAVNGTIRAAVWPVHIIIVFVLLSGTVFAESNHPTRCHRFFESEHSHDEIDGAAEDGNSATLLMALQSATVGLRFPRRMSVLNIAAGYGDDAYLLSAFFSQPAHQPLRRPQHRRDFPSGLILSPTVSVTSIEANPEEVSHANQVLERLRTLRNSDGLRNIRFLRADASQPEAYQSLAEKADFTLIRHPNVLGSSSKEMWLAMFRQAIERTKVGSFILFTTRWPEEMNALLLILTRNNLGIRLASAGERQLEPYRDSGSDAHFSLWQIQSQAR